MGTRGSACADFGPQLLSGMWGPWDFLQQTPPSRQEPQVFPGCSVHTGAAGRPSWTRLRHLFLLARAQEQGLSDTPHPRWAPESQAHCLRGHSMGLSALPCTLHLARFSGEQRRWAQPTPRGVAVQVGCRGVAWGKHEAGALQDPGDVARARSPKMPGRSQARALSRGKQLSAVQGAYERVSRGAGAPPAVEGAECRLEGASAEEGTEPSRPERLRSRLVLGGSWGADGS